MTTDTDDNNVDNADLCLPGSTQTLSTKRDRDGKEPDWVIVVEEEEKKILDVISDPHSRLRLRFEYPEVVTDAPRRAYIDDGSKVDLACDSAGRPWFDVTPVLETKCYTCTFEYVLQGASTQVQKKVAVTLRIRPSTEPFELLAS